jgi:hypothetical protein
VARRDSTRGRDPGGERISARPTRARLATAAAAAAAVTAFAIYPVVAVDRLAGLPLALGVAAGGVFVVGISGFDVRALALALTLLGAEYATFLSLRDEAAGGTTALYAARLVLASELAYWSLELRTAVDVTRTALRRRAATVSATVAGAFAVAGIVASAAQLRTGSGFLLDVAGAIALTAALFLVAQLAKR